MNGSYYPVYYEQTNMDNSGIMNNNNNNNSAKSKRRLKYTPKTQQTRRATSIILENNKNKISTPPMYNSPSDLIDSPPTPEVRRVERIVDQLTPRRIPDKRRKLLVKSLFPFSFHFLVPPRELLLRILVSSFWLFVLCILLFAVVLP